MFVKSIVNRVMFPLLLLAPVIAGAIAPVEDNTKRTPGIIPDTDLYQSDDLLAAITMVIQWALGFIGIIVFIMFLIAGFEYATAGGDESKTSTAQKRMVNAVIGMIILFFAFVASNAILGFAFQS
jgi:hypothetical protein